MAFRRQVALHQSLPELLMASGDTQHMEKYQPARRELIDSNQPRAQLQVQVRDDFGGIEAVAELGMRYHILNTALVRALPENAFVSIEGTIQLAHDILVSGTSQSFQSPSMMSTRRHLHSPGRKTSCC
jgi:hypothetical protein